MSIIILTGAFVALLLGVAAVLLLRTFFTSCISFAHSFDRADLSWRDYKPIQRLLDPADFEFLRRRGVAEVKIRKLRRERREIYRLCLRSLAEDFQKVQRTLTVVMVQSPVDRPDLAAEMARQKAAFYRNLVLAEAGLVWHACGFDHVPSVDLVNPFIALQDQLRQMAPAGAAC
jgi:hypothetical protein